jgi:hypothetical protein
MAARYRNVSIGQYKALCDAMNDEHSADADPFAGLPDADAAEARRLSACVVTSVAAEMAALRSKGRIVGFDEDAFQLAVLRHAATTVEAMADIHRRCET